MKKLILIFIYLNIVVLSIFSQMTPFYWSSFSDGNEKVHKGGIEISESMGVSLYLDATLPEMHNSAVISFPKLNEFLEALKTIKQQTKLYVKKELNSIHDVSIFWYSNEKKYSCIFAKLMIGLNWIDGKPNIHIVAIPCDETNKKECLKINMLFFDNIQILSLFEAFEI